MERTELDIFVKDLREYVREVWKETNEFPDYGRHTFRDGKGENENVF